MTVKHKLFVQKYLLTLNASQAAKDAGYSERTAKEIGHELLQREDVKEAIRIEISKIMDEEREVLKARIIGELKQLGFNDLETDVHRDKNGNALGVTRKDRLKALELLGKYVSLWTDKLEIQNGIHISFDRQDEDL